MYTAGKSTYFIANQFKVTPKTINKKLREAGVKIRTSGEAHLAKIPIQPVLEDYKSGIPAAHLAAKFDVSIATITSIIRRQGIAVRPPWSYKHSIGPTNKTIIQATCARCGNPTSLLKKSKYVNERRNGAFICSRCTGAKLNSPIVARCRCGKTQLLKHLKHARKFFCRSCLASMAARRLWKDPNYIEKMKERFTRDKESRSASTKGLWSNPVFRQKTTARIRESLLHNRPQRSLISQQMWQRPGFKQKMSEIMLKKWQEDEYRRKIASSSQPRYSKIHRTLSELLSDMGVPHTNEFTLGPWTFDVMIERPGRRRLLIEVNGNWIHSQQAKKLADQQKFTYFERYLINDYELKYLWEHEFYTMDRIRNVVNSWLGRECGRIKFDIEKTTIKPASAEDCDTFLGKYHYLSKIGRSGICLAGYVDDVMTSVAVFTAVLRKEMATSEGLKCQEVLELSRFCIHPSYQVKNYASWLLSRFCKIVADTRTDIKVLLAFSDETHNHYGTIYKACNWTYVRQVDPDYWYSDKDGWVMHKKTLWNRASNLKISEREYADKYGFVRVYGKKKHKFLVRLRP